MGSHSFWIRGGERTTFKVDDAHVVQVEQNHSAERVRLVLLAHPGDVEFEVDMPADEFALLVRLAGFAPVVPLLEAIRAPGDGDGALERITPRVTVTPQPMAFAPVGDVEKVSALKPFEAPTFAPTTCRACGRPALDDHRCAPLPMTEVVLSDPSAEPARRSLLRSLAPWLALIVGLACWYVAARVLVVLGPVQGAPAFGWVLAGLWLAWVWCAARGEAHAEAAAPPEGPPREAVCSLCERCRKCCPDRAHACETCYRCTCPGAEFDRRTRVYF